MSDDKLGYRDEFDPKLVERAAKRKAAYTQNSLLVVEDACPYFTLHRLMYAEIREVSDKWFAKIKQLRESCPHTELTGPLQDCGGTARLCKRCMKEFPA